MTSKPPSRVLLLHGFFSGRAAWDRIRRELGRSGIETLAPDLLGYGDHRHGHGPGQYSLEATVQHLLPAVEQFRPTHVIGHSMGGMVSLSLERAWPGAFEAIGLIGLPVFADARDGKTHQELRGRRFKFYMRTHGFSHFGCGIVHATRRGWMPFAHHVAPRQTRSMFDTVFLHSREAHLVGLTGIAFGGHVPTLARSVEAPVAMLHGDNDRAAPIDRARAIAEERGWDFELAKRSNHQVIIERPLLVSDWIHRKVLRCV